MEQINAKKRVEVSFPLETFSLIQRAATIRGLSISGYCSAMCFEKAVDDVNRFENVNSVVLSEDGWNTLMNVQLSPKSDTPAMAKAKKRAAEIPMIQPVGKDPD